ncbi:hypothetical protein FM103_01080 [Corynebacterium xerosis]|nr:hypothetical protein FM103_01080 [Corynebacterium xerosis]
MSWRGRPGRGGRASSALQRTDPVGRIGRGVAEIVGAGMRKGAGRHAPTIHPNMSGLMSGHEPAGMAR